jgi:O-antigen ligase
MKSALEPIRLWISVAIFMAVVITTSYSYSSHLLAYFYSLSGLALAAMWLVPAQSQITRLGKIALAVAMLAVTWVALQLVPLPPQLWQSLQGRGFLVDSLAAFGMPNPWLPLSLSPSNTAEALMSVVPAIGFFCCGLQLPYNKRLIFVAAIVLAAVLNVVFGLGVKYAPPGTDSIFAVFSKSSSISGFFLNRNFFAALLYVSIPMLVALLLQMVARGRLNKFTALVLGIIYLGIILVGLAVSASRTGILLSMGSLMLAPFLARGVWTATGNHAVSRLALIGMLVGFVVMGQFGLVAISRFAQIDSVNEQRFTMYSITARAIGQYLPWGSGFGSFVPVYQRYELPADMVGNAYINHAHNDWLEIILEGGLPMAAFLVIFLAYAIVATFVIWRRPLTQATDLAPRAASLAVWFLMLHSLVDYPLRTPALMAVFGLCLGLMSASPAPVKTSRPGSAPRQSRLPRVAPVRGEGPLWPKGKSGIRPEASPQA